MHLSLSAGHLENEAQTIKKHIKKLHSFFNSFYKIIQSCVELFSLTLFINIKVNNYHSITSGLFVSYFALKSKKSNV